MNVCKKIEQMADDMERIYALIDNLSKSGTCKSRALRSCAKHTRAELRRLKLLVMGRWAVEVERGKSLQHERNVANNLLQSKNITVNPIKASAPGLRESALAGVAQEDKERMLHEFSQGVMPVMPEPEAAILEELEV